MAPDRISQEKSRLRKRLLHQRQSLSPQDWHHHSDRLWERLTRLPDFQRATTVLAYMSHRREPDLAGLFQHSHKIWGLPRCQGENLTWHHYQPGIDRLTPGQFGILEPDLDWQELTLEQVDLVLVPCVAGDRQGYRLGYGGGYYDRLFMDSAWRRIPRIGLLFHFALLERLPHHDWDIPLNGVCTEEATIMI
ncbi:5-formyltetrahydrofolate cyclo-ligase [Candidatus Synechococcus calcipolaris G9]|uniref:5-formyltetrahydrofolate cyclo-ligase n=1 Tax=Candidatus Synechococcus calcipolaris G9 TaxID=1497997 RepID=A0ABT6EXU5_9SYNE|nr:5-formyltetrahydrofolate cyclo-ligase [Candidatus Synechococcus calcipolaris]MDG2989913.1 5-formyltetrahydrofolate cyclo-ligase [Candidatus Synechococcus calcipolaris G9]